MPKPTRKSPFSELNPELPIAIDSDVVGDAKPTITARDLQDLKFFKRIRPMLESLHDIGTRRDTAGNRDLHMDQYCVLALMWMFNPILTSLRGLFFRMMKQLLGCRHLLRPSTAVLRFKCTWRSSPAC